MDIFRKDEECCKQYGEKENGHIETIGKEEAVQAHYHNRMA